MFVFYIKEAHLHNFVDQDKTGLLLINKNMTALNLTDIPSNIDTLEKLGMWVGFALSEINLATSATEAPGYTQRVAQAGIFYVETDNRHRALIRLSIPVDKAHFCTFAHLRRARGINALRCKVSTGLWI